jgi:lipopolysaccharide/colanic/teichoic acid biosynthesis glycosyltransferase
MEIPAVPKRPWKRSLSMERLAPEALHSAKRFPAVIERERMRADRSGLMFCLLVLTPRNKDRGPCDVNLFAQALLWRLRITDEVGWWDQRALGVLLPDTPLAGARKVVNDILALAAEQSLVVDCEVYVYPSQEPPPTDDGSSDAHVAGPLRVPERAAAPSARDADDFCLAQPLEGLLIQPLPAWKRLVDIVGAVVGLVLFFPLMAAVAAVIKLTSPGPIFFRQQRDGLGGKRFTLYKFRTMHVDAAQRKSELLAYSEQDGPAFKLTHDPRVTWFGRWLRRTCIDELPQFWNVLRGEMSLVGPRPMDSEEAKHCRVWQRRRLDVTPGMTCIWQVRGGSRVSFAEWMRMDIRYSRRRTLWQDLRLMFETFVAVVRHRASR